MKTRLLALCLAVVGLTSVHASDQHDNNTHLWVNYVGDHPLFGTPWGLHLEVQNRLADFGEKWQQLLIRPGLNYTISPTLTVSAGYAYVETHPYGDYPALDEFPEHRLWEQAVLTRQALGLEWQHRLRLEQRRIGELQRNATGGYDVGNYRYENRIRYMLRTTVPLTADKKTYLALWDEVFFNFGSNVVKNYFDQNRLFIGVGRKLSDTTRLEIGYMEQTIQRRGGAIWENNHTVSVWLMSKWPFGRKG